MWRERTACGKGLLILFFIQKMIGHMCHFRIKSTGTIEEAILNRLEIRLYATVYGKIVECLK